jgi:hypothetical protein
MYDAEYFEILAHGGTGNLDFDPVMLSISHIINGTERPIKCCPPKKEDVKRRARWMFKLRALVWLAVLLNNGCLIFALFEIMRISIGSGNGFVIFGLMLFSTAAIIGMQLFI